MKSSIDKYYKLLRIDVQNHEKYVVNMKVLYGIVKKYHHNIIKNSMAESEKVSIRK